MVQDHFAGLELTLFIYCSINVLCSVINRENFFYSAPADPKLIKITPWMMVNGKINEIALKKWCVSILSYCLKNPKIQFTEITKKFCFLKPLDIYSILEVSCNSFFFYFSFVNS